MQVNSTPSFGARIVINKKSIKRLAENAKDVGVLSAQTSALPSKTVMDASFYPFDAKSGHRTLNALDKISANVSCLSDRSVLKNGKYDSATISEAATGSGLVSSGFGSYASGAFETIGSVGAIRDNALYELAHNTTTNGLIEDHCAHSTAGLISFNSGLLANISGKAFLEDNAIGEKIIKKIPN